MPRHYTRRLVPLTWLSELGEHPINSPKEKQFWTWPIWINLMGFLAFFFWFVFLSLARVRSLFRSQSNVYPLPLSLSLSLSPSLSLRIHIFKQCRYIQKLHINGDAWAESVIISLSVYVFVSVTVFVSVSVSIAVAVAVSVSVSLSFSFSLSLSSSLSPPLSLLWYTSHQSIVSAPTWQRTGTGGE